MQRYDKNPYLYNNYTHNLLIYKQIQEITSPAQVSVQVSAGKQQKREPTIADSLQKYTKGTVLFVYLIYLRIPVRFRFIVEPIVVKYSP